jgi:hypothetical protein
VDEPFAAHLPARDLDSRWLPIFGVVGIDHGVRAEGRRDAERVPRAVRPIADPAGVDTESRRDPGKRMRHADGRPA